jgi:RND family efflux transporter MFP subunit
MTEPRSPKRRVTARAAAVVLLASIAVSSPAGAAETFTVHVTQMEDLKQVFATVRSKDLIEARVRTPGTVVTLKVDEGVEVQPGQLLATVADPKIALRIKAADAQIVALESRLTTAGLDFERAEQLLKRGVTPQARVDQLRTALDVARNELAAARAERQVAEEQASEGQVLAPAAGRVLKVPVTSGSVVMAGESVATIAANAYLLRLELPERHARFMRAGDTLRVGARGLSVADTATPVGVAGSATPSGVAGSATPSGVAGSATPSGVAGSATVSGKIVQVYPELQGGRVIADAEAPGLGDYFVGERARVWISAGKRPGVVVPTGFVFARFGLDFVAVKGSDGKPVDVVVQRGSAAALDGGGDGVEILAGLAAGDVIVKPEVTR